MGWLKQFGRRPAVQRAIGTTLAAYLRLVRRTTRFRLDPPEPHRDVRAMFPVIVAMWHGQHFMVPFLRAPDQRSASLVSRSRDGEINAIALEKLGIRAIRGSGARGRDPRSKGGAGALRAMLKALADGETVVLTADVPKIARRAGEGIVTLARLSGRAIVPVAVVSRRRLLFGSWDRASIGLPFGRGAMVVGTPIHVGRDADPAALEEARRAVEAELDRVHAKAFAMIGRADPGAGLRSQVSADVAGMGSP
jgi:lysophospholipid acyltransferase (LPLAT)-like uncharacterized protein